MRKQQTLILLGATPRPSLYAAWNAEMPNGEALFIAWAKESEFRNEELISSTIFIFNHPANTKPGGKRRKKDIDRILQTGEKAYLILADGEPAKGIRNGIRDVIYRINIQNLDDRVIAIPIYNCSLTGWHHEVKDDVEDAIEMSIRESNIDETEKESIIKARRGQGVYRQNLIKYWKGCAVSGYKGISLLVASHIQPWSESSNEQRLNKYNGLLLLPNLDKAFDAGLITFESNGNISISPQLQEPEKLGINATMKILTTLTPAHEIFMEYHRNKIFKY